MLLLGCSTAPDLKNLHWRAGKAEVLPLMVVRDGEHNIDSNGKVE